jgi:Tfp pilus assembly protein PilN
MSTINLLPEDYLKRRAQHHANVVCSILFVVVMGSVVGAALMSEQSAKHTQQVRDSVTASYDEAGRLIEQMQRLESRKGAMLAKAGETASLMERVPRSYLLGVVTNALPTGAGLTQYDLDVKAVVTRETIESSRAKAAGQRPTKYGAAGARPEPPPTVVTMEVTGLACTDVDVARFIANMARNPLLASVDLVYSEEKVVDKLPVREFRVRMELRPGADAINPVRESPRAAAESLSLAETGAGR